QGERGLTMEPLYQGEPILAVAAVDEKTAAEAIEAIEIEFEPLPFVVDPIESLRPNGAHARTHGNDWMRPTPPPAGPAARGRDAARGGAQTPPAAGAPQAAAPAAGAAAGAAPGREGAGGAQGARGQAADAGRGGRGRGGAPAGPPPPQIAVLKWTEDDFKNAPEGMMPTGKATDEWTFGNVDEAMKKADLVLEETFMTQSTGHQPLETRTAMAYWQNGKLYLHGSTQSTVQTVASVARWVGIPPAQAQSQVVLISEFTGGGFGSKIPGSI